MTINQQRKPPAKRAFPGLVGRETTPAAATTPSADQPPRRRGSKETPAALAAVSPGRLPKEEAQTVASRFRQLFQPTEAEAEAVIRAMVEMNDLHRTGGVTSGEPPKRRGRPRLPDGPKSAAERKRKSRERIILEELETARRAAITATLQSSDTKGRDRDEITPSNSKLEVIHAAKWRTAHTGGGRRVKPSGQSLKTMEDENGNPRSPQYATKETVKTFVKRQKWPLNWSLSPAAMEYYVGELTGGLLDSEGNKIPGVFNVVETDDGAVGVCSLCGVTVEDWNYGPPFVSLGKPGRDERDTILGGACAHLWLVHKKLVNEYLKQNAPARVATPSKKCSPEDHARTAKNIAANTNPLFNTGAFCKVCKEWIDATKAAATVPG